MTCQEMNRASDVFPREDSDAKVKEAKQWLNNKGVRDLEAVSLYCDQLDKVCVSFRNLNMLIVL